MRVGKRARPGATQQSAPTWALLNRLTTESNPAGAGPTYTKDPPMPNLTHQPPPAPIDPTIPGEIAKLPTTPGSAVRAHAAFSPRVRVWELGIDRKWYDTHGNRRSPAQLRDAITLYVAPTTDGPERAA